MSTDQSNVVYRFNLDLGPQPAIEGVVADYWQTDGFGETEAIALANAMKANLGPYAYGFNVQKIVTDQTLYQLNLDSGVFE